MAPVKLVHSDLGEHHVSIFQQLQSFRKEGQLCDLSLESRGGTQHRAHSAVLCAASVGLKNMLLGPFLEADQVQRGQPVEIAASDAVVGALLEYLYGGEPELELEDSIELLRLADAYHLPKLIMTVEEGIRASLDDAGAAGALKVLQQTQGMHVLQAACEEKVAVHFETCIELVEFLELSASQLGQILKREDLRVSQEEVVLEGLFKWLNSSKDRGAFLGLLLQNIDFPSLSSSNLERVRCFAASMGPTGHDLQRGVDEAQQAQRKRCMSLTPDFFRPKRQCLQHWSPGLGASTKAPQKVLPLAHSMCWHEGAILFFQPSGGIRSWKPGESQTRAVAGTGARVNGVNDLGNHCVVSASPQGEIFVVEEESERLLSFWHGSGKVVLAGIVCPLSICCAPTGVVYLLTDDGTKVQKLVGTTLQPLVSSETLPADLKFEANDLFVTKEEVVYIADQHCILRILPGDAKPVIVGAPPNKQNSNLIAVYVTEGGRIYVADRAQETVWAFYPGDTVWTEVVLCPESLVPIDVLVQDRSLYVTMLDHQRDPAAEGIYEYLHCPEIQLQ